jgi:hypothetical protein
MDKANIFLFNYLKDNIIYKPEIPIIYNRKSDFITLQRKLVTWRENGISYNEKYKNNSLTKNEVWNILKSLGYKVNEFNFKELHKKEHFDYIGKEIYYRNDVNDSDDKSKLSPELVNKYNKDGLNTVIIFALRFPEKRGFILHSDGRIEQH